MQRVVAAPDSLMACTFRGSEAVRKFCMPQAKRVLLKGRPPFAYDVLSVNVGITPAATAVPGALDFATPVKPISRQGTVYLLCRSVLQIAPALCTSTASIWMLGTT